MNMLASLPPASPQGSHGQVAEWSNAHAWKACEGWGLMFQEG